MALQAEIEMLKTLVHNVMSLCVLWRRKLNISVVENGYNPKMGIWFMCCLIMDFLCYTSDKISRSKYLICGFLGMLFLCID